ncbi:putative NRPS-like protein biosynthetic cluster [Paramyrothecium foliicola]|nr:putative NRPS-like protein biosynthetic cluster [Paramyrothecium foliicola]
MQTQDEWKFDLTLQDLYALPPSALRLDDRFQAWVNSDVAPKNVLASIPPDHEVSYRPIHLLHTLLLERPGPWPVDLLLKHHARVRRYLPTRLHAEQDDLHWVLEAVQTQVKQTYRSFSQFLWDLDVPALKSTTPGIHITHHDLVDFVRSFALPIGRHGDETSTQYGGTRKPVVSVALPNGPVFAAACLAVMDCYIAAPVNPLTGHEQFKSDVLQSGSSCIITTIKLYETLRLADEWVEANGITVVFLQWEPGSGFKLSDSQGQSLTHSQAKRQTPNEADDMGLILFTSGTSGTKKLVPLTIHSIISGASFVIDTWGLKGDDTCLNMMPLHHVGGLIRNIVAPLFAGGSVICCPTFDPSLFWDMVETSGPTWYYASPTMHHLILSSIRENSITRSNIRLVCNAAGDLLPSLASQLQQTFKSIVLPSYGMTECMPISTPPLDYKLERPGTSGYSCGPCIAILDWVGKQVPTGTVGRICIRGEPLFQGYLQKDGSLDQSCFDESGWFDTGDIGLFNIDGYLYITGRSKEVINRGGELISPFEVENAIINAAKSGETSISGKVDQALAFSVPHDVLQEVVAVVLVTPPGEYRIDLGTLHEAIRNSLQQAKWPVMICYMNDLPKVNNKIVRIGLAKRLGIELYHDDIPYISRHLEAWCPPLNTPLSVSISSWPLQHDKAAIYRLLRTLIPCFFETYLRLRPSDSLLELIIGPGPDETMTFEPSLARQIEHELHRKLHAYLVPSKIVVVQRPLPADEFGTVDEDLLQEMLDQMQGSTDQTSDEDTTELGVLAAFAAVLGCGARDISPSDDFFSIGGDSIRSGHLVSLLRSKFGVNLSITTIFENGTARSISKAIETLKSSVESNPDKDSSVLACRTSHSSANPLLMAVQLVPIAILYPMRRGSQWILFLLCMSYAQRWPTNDVVYGRLANLVVSILFARVCMRVVAPIVGILTKWVVIGRYKEGLYPMWGVYHTRWWIVQKVVSICGKGVFGLNDTTNNLYCRLMGAKVGRNVKFRGCNLGEWDLLDLRDGSSGNKCVCRPFAVEGNASMYLGRIVIGENASVGLTTIVAPGTEVLANAHLGPNSSSWEEDNDSGSPWMDRVPNPPYFLTFFITYPLLVLGWCLEMLPWLGGLVGMVLEQPGTSEDSLRHIMFWFSEPHRVGYHFLALVLRVLFSPFIAFGFACAVTGLLDMLFGKIPPPGGPHRSGFETWRSSLNRALLPNSKLHDMTALFGQHYEATSIALRLLGARIGKRVYWPGTGPSISDYHRLDVGDDVVFGSRAHIVASDRVGSYVVTVNNGAMIADRVVLQPGVNIGRKTIMGTGSLTRRGERYASGATYVGSRRGDAVHLSNRRGRKKAELISVDVNDDWTTNDSAHDLLANHQGSGNDDDSDHDQNAPTLSPFGRAFFLKQAPYHVYSSFVIFCYSSFTIVFTAIFWNIPSVMAIQFVRHSYLSLTRDAPQCDVAIIWGLMTLCIAILTTLLAIVALTIVVVSKNVLIGRRVPGHYDWDKSSYCQRWQLHLAIERLRRHCYRSQGILGLLTGTEWLVWYYRLLGAKIGRDCALFANGRPTVMFTEPDLVTIGDRVAIDDASVIAHINTQGKFDLNTLEIGDGSVLRTGSRLLSGATMKARSCLLEHTLIMSGDTVEKGVTMQGWPAERFVGERVKARIDLLK